MDPPSFPISESSSASYCVDPEDIQVENMVHDVQNAIVDSWVAVKVQQKLTSTKGRAIEAHKIFLGRVGFNNTCF